jgi:uncharacterized protein (DUF1800 family)
MFADGEKKAGKQAEKNADPDAPERGVFQAAGEPVDPAWAWAPYEPDAQRPWDLPRAGHLYRRAAFGASWDQLRQAIEDGPHRAIDRLLRPDALDADRAAFHRAEEEYEAAAAESGSAEGLRAWWLRRMVQTPHPLLEKMTLFWRHHFATSGAKAMGGGLIHRHVRLLRCHALGSFAALLRGISQDPAVLVSLDASSNRKSRPGVHLARALLERFTLGPGRFSEKDVEEVARAFTGWFVIRGELRYLQREHDSGVKRVLGREGAFAGEDVVRIVLEESATARLVVRRLYRWLVSEVSEPADDLIAPLADSFRRNYDIAAPVGTILRSNLFFSRAAYRQRIKSPVEFALGIVKALEGSVATAPLGRDLASLGQDLCRPPTAKGWNGGSSWIHWSTHLGRSNLARALLARGDPYGGALDPLAVARKHGRGEPESAARFLIDLLFQGDVEDGVRRSVMEAAVEIAALPGGAALGDAWLRQLAHLVVTLPEFQLA